MLRRRKGEVGENKRKKRREVRWRGKKGREVRWRRNERRREGGYIENHEMEEKMKKGKQKKVVNMKENKEKVELMKYRVIFFTGPTQKSSKCGTGPT